MFEQLKEKFRTYFLSPLKTLLLELVQTLKNIRRNHWLAALATVVVLTILGLFLARLFLSLATVDLPPDDTSLIGQLKASAQKFINFAGGNFVEADRAAARQAEKVRAEKEAVLQAKLNTMEKFSRITFFYTAPYLGSIAIPEAWEKKYRVAEENNLIDFYYAPTPEEEYPLFQIGILSRDEWEKKQATEKNLETLNVVSNFVFFYQSYAAEINNPVKEMDYLGMQKQVKSILNSFKSYKQQ
jgi:hypothetical protein